MQPHKNTDGEGPNTVAEPYLTDKRPYESLLDSKSGAALNQVLDELMNLVWESALFIPVRGQARGTAV